MAFVVIAKESNEVELFGSLPPVSDYTGLTKNQLRVVFSNEKKLEFDNNDYRIVRRELKTGGKKK